MRALIASLILLALPAGCGADGPPKPPADEPAPGLSVSGMVKVGVSGS
ncbi:argininosuccinate lyase [Defluviimonas sp. WL0024]|uniref:Argininosuccinate lyase n=2 Tax=Albidovulum TaxID=205889 RepID=A0ABT3IZ01_9RHOB|nr:MULTISPECIES: argininosuccinate lyase [Defluviimonas]MCU9848587.1 argininosuccinate lyase [Defluviimonas sp. WL0024]MCW3780429.1 argininosuccinate lyase [Defluviimonas salinarum]